jgi:DNA-directed RNA polymerase subunit RPC12/RpoP
VAEGRRFACTACGFDVVAWSDGNPYYRDERGRKRYAYHPDHENLARCVGNDVPHLCLACGKATKVDSARQRVRCRSCKADALVPTWELGGRTCPKCRRGELVVDETFRVLS